ncbi:MAG: Hsp20/alpha crystallin family protein [Moorea sp. SIOASIH]|uniref:Hsp20/alpha crystallin family protein n=1 Tax=Moorena sp. SIOASIH TaxID=2607817 RepID=UPI0013B6027F|nr:Hsp20/alpha crystallin family protein [Moorena sp. SIOASIH]NEO37252.1 Hsp20/alpha crystallin family protein [Moorena sp. SIOASIH]
MTLVRWNPWKDINTLQREIDQLFDHSFVPNTLREFGHFKNVPAAELTQTEDAINLKLEVPGMEAKDLNVEVTDTVVAISGERKEETNTDEKGVKRSEFRYGKFQRVIPLPVRVQNTKVEAEYKDGILNLTLPKAEEEKNKVVKVNLN